MFWFVVAFMSAVWLLPAAVVWLFLKFVRPSFLADSPQQRGALVMFGPLTLAAGLLFYFFDALDNGAKALSTFLGKTLK